MDLTLKEMDDLEVWSDDQQYQYHLGTCWTYRLSGSLPCDGTKICIWINAQVFL